MHTLVSEVLDQGCANISEILQMTSIKERNEKEGVHLNNFSEIRRVFAQEADVQEKDQTEKQTENSTETASNGPKSWWGRLKDTFSTRSREAIMVPHKDSLSNVPLERHIKLEASVELNETKNKEDTLSAKCAREVPKRRGGLKNNKIHPLPYSSQGNIVKKSSGHKVKMSTSTTSDHKNAPLPAAPLIEEIPPKSTSLIEEIPPQSTSLIEEIPPKSTSLIEEIPPQSTSLIEEIPTPPAPKKIVSLWNRFKKFCC
ncbi:uncharacterized protein LOC114436603 [Parambassis ranga]|uniref:Uncharacterized protein LOC114435932 n=1 Tax=Parambassis ranga TaxID=210632 RepID=A0A6P7IPZ2_9TELE|nr:uncharacterized protein LOC114435932 [Parambassis ranga]XP_028262739.1 uncharacterized protein LOC114436603 [Parambassis ranga]